MSEQIKRAIAKIRDFGLHHAIKDLPHSTYTVEAFELAIECMEKELGRQENNPLELSELKEMVGEPVWYEGEALWVVIRAIFHQDYREEDYDRYQLEEEDEENGYHNVYVGEFHINYEFRKGDFYKHKPTE